MNISLKKLVLCALSLCIVSLNMQASKGTNPSPSSVGQSEAEEAERAAAARLRRQEEERLAVARRVAESVQRTAEIIDEMRREIRFEQNVSMLRGVLSRIPGLQFPDQEVRAALRASAEETSDERNQLRRALDILFIQRQQEQRI